MKSFLKKLAGNLLNTALKAVEQELAKRLRNRVNAGISSVDEPKRSIDGLTSFDDLNSETFERR
jgi:hypothetical protein